MTENEKKEMLEELEKIKKRYYALGGKVDDFRRKLYHA